MRSPDPVASTAAEAAFLARCREDLAGLFAPADDVVAVVRLPSPDGQVRLEARVAVSGLAGTFAAGGETVVDAYAALRAAAPEERLALAFRAIVEAPARR